MTKPIKVFWSELSQRFYASAHYKQEGSSVTITGEKFDVTDDIAHAIINFDIEFTPKVTPAKATASKGQWKKEDSKNYIYIRDSSVVGTVKEGTHGYCWVANGCWEEMEDTPLGIHTRINAAKEAVKRWYEATRDRQRGA